jgi:hypothetical protein
MRKVTQLGLLLGLAAMTCGCATMNEGECQNADWYNQGVDDGVAGHNRSRIDAYADDCGEFGIPPDARAWRAGWALGIEQFCTAERGYEEGIEGRSYGNSCPEDIEPPFMSAYLLGRGLYDQRSRVENERTELERINDRLSRSDLSDEQRRSLRRQRNRQRDDVAQEEWRLREAAQRARAQGFPAYY